MVLSDNKNPIYDKKSSEKCLVIGGAGMLGYELSQQLVSMGYRVRVLDLVPVKIPHVESIVGDIRNISDIRDACDKIDIVFHTAAAVWNPLTPKETYEEVNVYGTQFVISVCRELGISRLIYTSSMDVVVNGKKPIVNGDESLQYPPRLPKDPYSRTKIIAEKDILAANSEYLATCALRPVGMYGPRDKYHVPSIIDVARSKNNIRLGNGTARFSHVFVGNVAHAHVLAAQNLSINSKISGKAYFITDHEPAENLFEFMVPFIKEMGLNPPKTSIPYPIAYGLAWIAEKMYSKSKFNTFSVIQTCIDHTFVSKKASEDFGYYPRYTKDEAFESTLHWLLEEYA